MASSQILVVDEEASRRRVNAFGLRCAGFSVCEANDPVAAFALIRQSCPQLVLIVSSVLDSSVHDFVHSLRSDSHTRDLMLMALVEHESELDAAAALDCGIDDYILEPISPQSFVQRIRSGLERRSTRGALTQAALGLSLERETGLLNNGARVVTLGPKERQLLSLFLENPNKVLPRDLLLFRIWGGAKGLHSRVLDVSVCRLRHALDQLGCTDLIQTVSGQGYRFGAPAHSPRAQSSKTSTTQEMTR